MKWPALILIALLSGVVNAGMEKYALTCESSPKLCFFWWPKLPEVAGWHHEQDQSYKISANALAPDGSTFANAETVMYAKGLYKPRIPKTTSLAVLIEDDKKAFLTNARGVEIAEATSIQTGDGQKLRSLTFFPRGEGNWERVSYGEEGDFYLVFSISSRTRGGYEKALPKYEAMIHAYKEKL